MRPTRSLLVAFLALLLWSAESLAQPPDGGGGGGRRRGGGSSDGQGQDGGGRRRGGGPDGKGGGPSSDGQSRGYGRGSRGSSFRGGDPSAAFDRLSGGKDVWKRSDAEAKGQTSLFDKFAEGIGATNGEITRAQFIAYIEKKTTKQDAIASGSADPNAAKYAQMAEYSFKSLDKHGDGHLTYDEMPEDLRAELKKWDTNNNGTIELEEYKAYYIARKEQRKADWSDARSNYAGSVSPGAMPVIPGRPTPGKAEPKKPLVYTKSNLPKDLPSWFRDLADGDAQIAFFEWRSAGRSYDEFRKYDLNNDGFITVDEVLAYQAQSKKSTGSKPGFTVVQGGETIPGTGTGPLPGADSSPVRVDRGSPVPASNPNVPVLRIDRSNFPPGGTMPSRFDPNRVRGFRGRGDQGGGSQPPAPVILAPAQGQAPVAPPPPVRIRSDQMKASPEK